jgi:hypothetical protein
MKNRKPTKEGNEKEMTPKSTPKKKKKEVSIDEKEAKQKKNSTNGRKCAPEKKDDRKIPRVYTRKMKNKRKRRRHQPLYFKPLIECKFVLNFIIIHTHYTILLNYGNCQTK